MRRLSWSAGPILAVVLSGAWAPAEAQEQGRVAVEGITGHAGYVDEVWDNRVLAGGLVRMRVAPRLTVGPEVVYQHGEDENHELLVTGSVTYDLVTAERRVVPFIVGGAGFSRRTSLVGQGPGTQGLVPFTSHEFTASGGAGVRIAMSRTVYLSADARLGWEPERRLTVGIGWRP